MWNIKHLYRNKKGFLLLELILSISLTSILVLSFLSMLEYSTNATIIGESYDEALLNGRYTIEYIKEEIRSADRIISTDKINNFNHKYPNNFGFIIMQDIYNYRYESDEYRYRFISYYLDGTVIQRVACTKVTDSNPTVSNLTGHNVLSENIISITNSNVDFNNNLINLNIDLGLDGKVISNFKSTIYLDCEIDY